MQIRQHLPNYVDGKPETKKFSSTNQLMRIGWVKDWTKAPGFFQFSIAGIKPRLLICECDRGQVWWVVGYIEGDGVIDLPNWIAKFKE